MAKQKPYLTYAVDSDGYLAHIDAVATGLLCGCTCPHCHSELCAKNGGGYRVHHFAHVNGSDCVGAVESALHRMAKDILQKNCKVMLPPVYDNVQNNVVVTFSKVEVEYYDKTLSLRPDCVGYTDTGEEFWIEFKRTHEVDSKKAGKIISAQKECIEIDLNECELNPITLQNFIEKEVRNRKWIYTCKRPKSWYYDHITKHRGNNHFNNDNLSEMKRHWAIDESGSVVNLLELSEINTFEHTYYCIGCGKEVVIVVDNYGLYYFEHIEKNHVCDDDYFLHETAKRILFEKFKESTVFNIKVSQILRCEEHLRCKFPFADKCTASVDISYDLKKLGYNECIMDFMYPHVSYRCDIILLRNNEIETSIIISIVTESCYIEVLSMNKRTIEVFVNDENDLYQLYQGSLEDNMVKMQMHNFNHISSQFISKERIDSSFLAFTLYESGKYYVSYINCYNQKSYRNAVYEIIFISDIENKHYAIKLAVYKCYQAKKKICLCEICLFMKLSYYSSDRICTRYKTKGTPRIPLESMPINCPFFMLDRNVDILFNTLINNVIIIEKTLEK